MLACFKAYDIRGRYPEEINEELAFKIGCAFAEVLRPSTVVLGRDIRLSSLSLSKALLEGLASMGVDVLDLGLCGTEQVYFATAHLKTEGGIMITASHNPANYNGMKLVRKGAAPISGDSGLKEIGQLVCKGGFKAVAHRGQISPTDPTAHYIEHLLSYSSPQDLKPLKIVVNAGNGSAGPIIDLLEPHLPFDFIKLNHTPDGKFPEGVPNPLLTEHRDKTAKAVIDHKADLGLAWDGDFDRCFFFDERGRFIEGYYIVGLIAGEMLRRIPNSKIILDPRLRWNTLDIVTSMGGTPIVSKTGHAFIKERMRLEDAIYGGEMSAHHYFRDFHYCDSGMIPWLIVTKILSSSGRTLSELIDQRERLFPCSGEINREVANPDMIMQRVREAFEGECLGIDYIDGLSMEFKDWRFNLRASNTEPLMRLNVESRGLPELVEEKTAYLLRLIEAG